MTARRRVRSWARVLRALVAGLAALILVLPWARQVTGLAVFDGLDALLGMQCHRLAGRVMSFGGVPMAVCSRCAGVYAGILFGAALARPRLTPRTTVWVVVVAGAAMVAELGLEAVGLLGVNHVLRLTTGAALSWPVSALAVRWLGR